MSEATRTISTELGARPAAPPPLPQPPVHLTPLESLLPRAGFTRRWPAPAAAGPVPLVAAAGAGVAAAAAVPLDTTGIGWLLAGLAGAAAVAAGLLAPTSRRAGAPPAPQQPPAPEPTATEPPAPEPTATEPPAPEPAATEPPAPEPPAARDRRWRRAERLGWGLAGLVLLAAGAVRAAGWLFVLCLLAAAAAGLLALTGGRTVRGLALGALLLPAGAGRGVAWAQRSLGPLYRRAGTVARVGPTVAITAAVLLVFGGLLASADVAFSRVLGRITPDLAPASLARWGFLFAAAAALVLGAVFLLLAPPTVDPENPPEPAARVRLVEWAIPAGALVALFAGFVGVQLTVLFGGASYVLGPDGPTYAQYARGGFWQLLAVTALTLLVIGLAAWVAPRRTAVERWCLRGLLGALAVLTLVIVASALSRMYTYQEAYGFTRLRVLVSLVELWLGLVFVLVLAAGVRLRARWLPRAVVATGIVAVLALAALNPDRFIAERNIDRWASTGQLDVSYLAGLSADAVPALVCLPGPEREAALARISTALAGQPDDWRTANLARATARDLLAGSPGQPNCRN